MTTTPMARPQSENTTQVAFKISEEWIERADKLAVALSRPGITTATRTEILRAALGRGLAVLEEETPAPKRGRVTRPGGAR